MSLRARNLPEAELVKGLLEAEQTSSTVQEGALEAAFGEMAGNSGTLPSIWVKDPDFDNAALPAKCTDPGTPFGHAQLMQELGNGAGAFALLEAQAAEFVANPFVQGVRPEFNMLARLNRDGIGVRPRLGHV